MGFNIMGDGLGVGSDVLAINVLGGICNCMGRCSECREIFWFLVEVYWSLLGILI